MGAVTHRLAVGDCLAMRVDRPTAFRNPADRPTRYVLALTIGQVPAGGGEKER